jgi:hypothetical protein
VAKSKRDSEAAYRARKLEALSRAQQAKERRRTQRTIAIVVGVALVVLGTVVVPALLKGRGDSTADKQAEADAKRPVADFGVKAADAGCAAEVTQPAQEDWTKHVRGDWKYPDAPPVGGPHSQSTLSTGTDHFYARSEQPAPERAVHDMEHGLVVAWYDAALPESEVTALRQVAASAGEKKLRFVAVPWDRGPFTDDRHVVLAAWGVHQGCVHVSGGAVEAFIIKHADAPGLAERTFPV